MKAKIGKLSIGDIEAWLCEQVALCTGRNIDAIDSNLLFDDLGVSSIQGSKIVSDLEEHLDTSISSAIVYDHPTIASLAQFLGGVDKPQKEVVSSPTRQNQESIAIVGIGCRFPGSGVGPQSFFDSLLDGVDGITPLSGDRWKEGSNGTRSASSCYAGQLEGIDQFDPGHFGLTLDEANEMDPQQCLLLQAAVHALFDAGVSETELAGTDTGVFIGISHNEYGYGRYDATNVTRYSATGNSLSIAANRISYAFDLLGPSVAVDSACSSSLLAVHMACNSLRTGECDAVIAGGVNVVLRPDLSLGFDQAGVMAQDGRVKAFDDSADGYVRGEGVGVVLLQTLSSALKQNRNIYALIEGTATVQDGRSNGLMAPKGLSQQKVISKACKNSGLEPSDLDYIEAHGTGTKLGDVVEVEAISQVLRRSTKSSNCLIGSVKTNIGHLEAAAGIAGLIKTALCIKHRKIAANNNFSKPNNKIDFESKGIRVVERSQTWEPKGTWCLAGVSSFGFGGTNVHVVLREHEREIAEESEAVPLTLFLNCMSEKQFSSQIQLAIQHLSSVNLTESQKARSVKLTRLCGPPRNKVAVTGADCGEIVSRLRALDPTKVRLLDSSRALGVVYSGQGSLWTGVGRDLFRTEKAYRDSLLNCDEVIKSLVGESILPVMFDDRQGERLKSAVFGQLALFSLQVSLTNLIIPKTDEIEKVVGHSVGELAAAWASGALSLEDALHIIFERGRAMSELENKGRTALVISKVETVKQEIERFGGEVWITGYNDDHSVIISGTKVDVDEFLLKLASEGIVSKTVDVSYPNHCPLLEDTAAIFRRSLREFTVKERHADFYSSALGSKLLGHTDADYWVTNMLNPTQFGRAVASMINDGVSDFLEVGGHSMLRTSIENTLQTKSNAVIATLNRNGSGQADVAQTRTELFNRGFVRIEDLPGSNQASYSTLSIPFAFDERRCWSEMMSTGHNRPTENSLDEVETDNHLPWLDESASEESDSLERSAALDTHYVPAETPVEKLILKIWKEHLKVKEIGIDDELYSLGGDSVVGLHIVGEIYSTFGTKPDLDSDFQIDNFTIRNLAAVVEEELNNLVDSLDEEDVKQLLGND